MLEDQHASSITHQLDHRYEEEGLALQSQLGLEHFLLCTESLTPKPQTQDLPGEHSTVRGTVEREKGAKAHGSHPYPSLNRC